MKSKNLFKHLYRVIVLTVLTCVVAVSVSFTADSQNRMRQWHANEVLTAIDGWLVEFESAGESNRNNKIDAFNALSEYQMQMSNHAMHSEAIDSEFSFILDHIADSFFDMYLNMIDEIAEAVTGNNFEIEQYLLKLSTDIQKINDSFNHDNDPFVDTDIDITDDPDSDIDIDDDFDPDNDFDDDTVHIDSINDKSSKAELYAELYSLYSAFIDDDFIQLRVDANEEKFKELTEVKTLITDEGIIGTEKISFLSDIINTFVELYADTDNTVAGEVNSIKNMIDMELSLQRLWFEEHYTLLIDETENTDREDEYDDVTVINQIEELDAIIQIIEDDGVIRDDSLLLISDRINQLIEEYENELVLIEERIIQRNIEAEKAAKAAADAAAAAAAAAARRNNNTSSSSNNRNSNNNTSSNNTSNNNSNGSNSSSGTSSSGTQNNSGSENQSGTSNASSAGNNRYPSITSNCREILARLVKLEASGESADGKQAVAEVVLNRMISSRWSHANTVEEVVFDTKWAVQFTVKDLIWTDRGTPSSSDYAAVDRALGGSNVLTRDYVFFAGTPRTQIDIIWIGTHAFSK